MKKLYKKSKGVNLVMIREYVTPDFDVTIYEIEDIITVSGGSGPVDGGLDSDGWFE